jgi:hypothetical protein
MWKDIKANQCTVKFLMLEGSKSIYYSFIMSNLSFWPLVSLIVVRKPTRTNWKNYTIFVWQDFNCSYEDLLTKHGHCTLNVQRLRLHIGELTLASQFLHKLSVAPLKPDFATDQTLFQKLTLPT